MTTHSKKSFMPRTPLNNELRKKKYKENSYPLINNADKTGTQPLFNTGLVYLFRKTIKIQHGNNKK